jgi:hypothetical protein
MDGIMFPPPTNPDRILGMELEDFSWQGVLGKVCPVTLKN